MKTTFSPVSFVRYPHRRAVNPLRSPPQGHGDGANATFMNCVPYPMSNQMHPKIHSVMIFLVYFLIPLVIISVYYYHIARTLMKSAHDMPGEVRDHTRRQVRRLRPRVSVGGGGRSETLPDLTSRGDARITALTPPTFSSVSLNTAKFRVSTPSYLEKPVRKS